VSNFIKLTEIKETSQRWPSNIKKYMLDEVTVNSSMIVALRDGSFFKKEMKMYKGWPPGLDERIVLTEILLNLNGENNMIYAVGDFENITKKIGVGNG
tara:strand:- start:26 stop:319 length:294 start_codon:yes stop_codon:yes gene_type:complete